MPDALLSKEEADDFLDVEGDLHEKAARLGHRSRSFSLLSRMRLLLQHRKILVLGPLTLFLFVLLWNRTSNMPTPLPPEAEANVCPYSNVEIKMSTLWYSKDLLEALFDSYKMNMPCFPPFHISVPDGEVAQFEQYVIDERLPNVFIHPENIPKPRKTWAWEGKSASQWSEWVADEYIKAPWVLYLDVDLMFTMPFNCAMAFDGQGKPIVRYWPWWYQWPRNHEALERARQRFPSKWNWTWEDEARIRDDSYMSYFPVIVPTEVLKKSREIFEDAYDEPFADIMVSSVDYSQFDMFRRVTRLLYPEKMRWTPVELAAYAFADEAVYAAVEANYWADPVLHVPFHHAYDLNNVSPPGIGDGDERYWDRAKVVAKHSLCMRQALWPKLNEYDPDTLFRKMLPLESDRNCNSTDAMVPETIMTHMYDRTGFYDNDAIPAGKTRWIAGTFDDPRRLCTDAVPDSRPFSQSWWSPSPADM